MTKIKTLDRVALQNLRAPIEAELKALGERLGITLTLGNGTYGDGSEASYKLVLKVDDAEVKAKADKAAWDRNCRFIGIDYADVDNSGLRPEDFGTEFDYAGTKYRTTGIALKGKGSQKFPILVESLGGKVEAGKTMMLPDTAVKMIRAATDASGKAIAPRPAGGLTEVAAPGA